LSSITCSHYSTVQVIFEDGDRLDGIPVDKLCTEAEYKEAFGEDPPLPSEEQIRSPFEAQDDTGTQYSLTDTTDASAGAPLFPADEVAAKKAELLSAINIRRISPDPMTLQELYEYRCGKCELCTRRDCEHCFSCLRNSKGVNERKEVCLRKVSCFSV